MCYRKLRIFMVSVYLNIYVLTALNAHKDNFSRVQSKNVEHCEIKGKQIILRESDLKRDDSPQFGKLQCALAESRYLNMLHISIVL